MTLSKLNENQILKCEVAITESELLKALTSMDNKKSPGNDGIKSNFSYNFSMLLKNHFVLLSNSLL